MNIGGGSSKTTKKTTTTYRGNTQSTYKTPAKKTPPKPAPKPTPKPKPVYRGNTQSTYKTPTKKSPPKPTPVYRGNTQSTYKTTTAKKVTPTPQKKTVAETKQTLMEYRMYGGECSTGKGTGSKGIDISLTLRTELTSSNITKGTILDPFAHVTHLTFIDNQANVASGSNSGLSGTLTEGINGKNSISISANSNLGDYTFSQVFEEGGVGYSASLKDNDGKVTTVGFANNISEDNYSFYIEQSIPATETTSTGFQITGEINKTQTFVLATVVVAVGYGGSVLIPILLMPEVQEMLRRATS